MCTRPWRVSVTTRPVPPPNPYGVLVLSLLLPGTGHVLQGLPQRGLIFLFFIVLLGWVTLQLSFPTHSFLGRYAGGFLCTAFVRSTLTRWRACASSSGGRPHIHEQEWASVN